MYFIQLKFDPNHSQAKKQLDLIDPLKAEISEAKARYKSGDHQAAIDHLTKAIEVSYLFFLHLGCCPY